MNLRGLVLSVVVISAVVTPAFCQSQPNLENGFKRYGSYDGGSLDTVNNMNGNLMLHAPLLPDYPQRGKVTPHYNVYVTSKGWQVSCKPASNGSGQVCWWHGGVTGVSLQTSVGVTVHRTLNKSGSGTGTVTYQAYGFRITLEAKLRNANLYERRVHLSPRMLMTVERRTSSPTIATRAVTKRSLQ